MRTADERLRAAARDAAYIFPPSGDLPPLRLPAVTGGGATGRRATGRGATSRTRAFAAPVAAAAAVALVIAGLAMAHRSDEAQRRQLVAQRALARALALQRAERRALDALVIDAFMPATGPQNDVGGKLWWLIQARELPAIARCMAASGYHISDRPSPFDLAFAADNTQMPDLPRIARTRELVSLGAGNGWDGGSAEDKAYLACSKPADAPYQVLRRLGSKLQNPWWSMIFQIQLSAPVRAVIPALNACAARYGFPRGAYGRVYPPIRTLADFVDWIAGFLDGAGSRGASLHTLEALGRHWAPIFVSCARPTVVIWQRLQLAAQRGFLASHSRQVLQLEHLAWRLLMHPR